MELLKYAALRTDPLGGNSAGVLLDAEELDEAEMLVIAADLDSLDLDNILQALGWMREVLDPIPNPCGLRWRVAPDSRAAIECAASQPGLRLRRAGHDQSVSRWVCIG
jgi:Phenazine biosynthesis-like protein